jgi:hypothetical protein
MSTRTYAKYARAVSCALTSSVCLFLEKSEKQEHAERARRALGRSSLQRGHHGLVVLGVGQIVVRVVVVTVILGIVQRREAVGVGRRLGRLLLEHPHRRD